MPLTPSLALLAVLAMGSSTPLPALAMQSPWWENYDRIDRYLCNAQARVVLERNDSQASLITGRDQMTLFRENSELAGQRYSNGEMHVILKGDELTLERLPMRLICQRMEQV